MGIATEIEEMDTMQISTHEETEYHINGMCSCDNDAPYATPVTNPWRDEDVDEDNGDRPVNPGRGPARQGVTEAEARRRRAARRRF